MSLYTTRVWLRVKITKIYGIAPTKFGWYADGNADARTKGYFSDSETRYIEKITNDPDRVVEATAMEINASLVGNVQVEVIRVSRKHYEDDLRMIEALNAQAKLEVRQ